MDYKNIRGTHDLYGDKVSLFQMVESATALMAQKYNFSEIRTPIIEFANVFHKNIGNSTDIVNKEMYVFEDRNNEKIALRPEGTASVVRALISNGLSHTLPHKWYYVGPMFRYERPQKGRQRQFHQLGFEYLGTNSWVSDVEVINLANDLLQNLGIVNYELHLNSIGSIESLNNYKVALLSYLENKKNSLSEDSLKRLEVNPLRILDSKNEQDQELIINAPKILDYLIEKDKEHFNLVKSGLDALNIKYVLNHRLVRGLDYYTNTVFEFVTTELGAQGALIAGGRYDNLIGSMNGPQVGAFGFAGGIERLALMLNLQKSNKRAIALVLESTQGIQGLQLAQFIRNIGYSTDNILGKDISNKLKKVNAEVHFASVIIGINDSLDNFKLKDSTTMEQITLSLNNIEELLNSKYSMYKVQGNE
jgi:histidyl-tRNA synthetase